MRHWITYSIVGLLALTTAAQTPELPDDPKAVVMSLDYQGGYTPRRVDKRPALAIRADGTVVLPSLFVRGKAFEAKLAREEVLALLKSIVIEDRFFEAAAAHAKDEVGPLARCGVSIRDASTTVITVRTKKKKATAKQEALRWVAQQRPKEVTVNRLAAIERRLTTVKNVQLAGGPEKADDWLKRVNAKLLKKHPKAAPLELEHMTSVHHRPKGGRRIMYFRRVGGIETQGSVSIPAKGEAKIDVRMSYVK